MRIRFGLRNYFMPTNENIRDRLLSNNFREELLGEFRPPVAQYFVTTDDSFFAEFLAPLRGGGVRRNGERDATARIAGVSVQNCATSISSWQRHGAFQSTKAMATPFQLFATSRYPILPRRLSPKWSSIASVMRSITPKMSYISTTPLKSSLETFRQSALVFASDCGHHICRPLPLRRGQR